MEKESVNIKSQQIGGNPQDFQPVKILYLITRADNFGGSSVHVRDLASRMISEGHEVLVGIGGSGQVTEALTASGVPFSSLLHLARSGSLVNDLIAVRETRNLIRRYKPDLISTHTAKAGAVGRIAAVMTGVPVIYTPHCWSFEKVSKNQKLFRWIERILRPMGARTVCVSSDEQNLASRYKIGPASHYCTIHNGMEDIPDSYKARPKSSPARIVMIGRFEEQKNQVALVNALSNLAKLEWSVTFVGDGPLRLEAESTVAKTKQVGRIQFLGFQKDVKGILRDAQMYALISKWEGLPRSTIEAMRAGLPVIACDVGGNRETVINGKNGFLVAVGDNVQLTERLRELIENPLVREKMGMESRQMYEKRFTFEVMFRRTLALYGEVARSKSRLTHAMMI